MDACGGHGKRTSHKRNKKNKRQWQNISRCILCVCVRRLVLDWCCDDKNEMNFYLLLFGALAIRNMMYDLVYYTLEQRHQLSAFSHIFWRNGAGSERLGHVYEGRDNGADSRLPAAAIITKQLRYSALSWTIRNENGGTIGVRQTMLCELKDATCT